MTSDDLTGILIRTIPYPEQIRNFKTEISTNIDFKAVSFTWRGIDLRISSVSESNEIINVEEIENECLIGTNFCVILKALFKRAIIEQIREES